MGFVSIWSSSIPPFSALFPTFPFLWITFSAQSFFCWWVGLNFLLKETCSSFISWILLPFLSLVLGTTSFQIFYNVFHLSYQFVLSLLTIRPLMKIKPGTSLKCHSLYWICSGCTNLFFVWVLDLWYFIQCWTLIIEHAFAIINHNNSKET